MNIISAFLLQIIIISTMENINDYNSKKELGYCYLRNRGSIKIGIFTKRLLLFFSPGNRISFLFLLVGICNYLYYGNLFIRAVILNNLNKSFYFDFKSNLLIIFAIQTLLSIKSKVYKKITNKIMTNLSSILARDSENYAYKLIKKYSLTLSLNEIEIIENIRKIDMLLNDIDNMSKKENIEMGIITASYLGEIICKKYKFDWKFHESGNGFIYLIQTNKKYVVFNPLYAVFFYNKKIDNDNGRILTYYYHFLSSMFLKEENMEFYNMPI